MKQPSTIFRTAAWLLVPAQVLLAVPEPVWAAPPERGERKASEPPRVKVNRTLPKVQPVAAIPSFSDVPTDSEIFRARVFDEPLVPMGPTSATENRALADALLAYLKGGQTEDVAPLLRFIEAHPTSAWRAAILTDLGILYRRTGYFSRALDAWEEAWTAGKGESEPRAKAIADRAAGELAELNARLGRFDRLQTLFAETESRPVTGSAAEKLSGARAGYWLMQNKPEEAFRCGPMALDRILAYQNPAYRRDARIVSSRSTSKGTSLTQMRNLAAELGLKMQMARRGPGAEPLIPAMVHWKAGHFAALVRSEDGRYLVQDPTFGDELWVSETALNEEASGFFLVREGQLPKGWEAVSEDEGSQVWGKGNVGQTEPEETKKTSPQAKTCPSPQPMADYNIHLLVVSLNISDTPVGHTPPRGPAVRFQVTYNQRDAFQPQVFSYSNLGSRWTFDWLSYVEDNPSNPSQSVTVYMRGGGRETYSGYNSATQSYAPHLESRAVVVRTATSPIRYERQLPDGSVEVFSQADGAGAFPRHIFMTGWRDPQGNSLTFTYDASLRMVAVQDAIGQVTTISYANAADPLKITKVTDPFGRFAQFEYNTAGQLSKITDVIGIESAFEYGPGDFIRSLTTPYGTTRFTFGESGIQRWIETEDPLGGRERVDFRTQPAGVVASEPLSQVPTGVTVVNQYLDYRNTFYWDKRAMALYPGDYTKAHVTHWLHTIDVNVASGVVESEKQPLENRVWYTYPNQNQGPQFVGSQAHPTAVARVLDDGTTQVYRYEYNSLGKLCKAIDPLGRETRYTYGTNNVPDAVCTSGSGIDLLKVEQKNGVGYDVLETRTYNSQHLPLTVTDAAGQTTTYTYDPQGRITTVTTPPRAGITENRTRTYAYYPDTAPTGAGRIQTITGPATGATTSYTYDAYGRVRTTTDADNYALIYDYDALDRPTKATYPDATYEETVYNRLDAEKQRDRLGRWTHTFYDALRRPVATRDPLGRTVTQQWCNCGSLDKVIDANGNPTSWERDLQARMTKEIRADQSVKTFIYENTTSRLRSVTDARNQTKTYGYGLDDRLTSVTYTNAVIPTPNVTFSFMDPDNPTVPDPYGRLRLMTDGTGTTRYDYKPAGTLGAGSVSTVDGPLASDSVSYSYDELGRITTHGLLAFSTTWGYDALGRLTTLTSPMGNFLWTYVNTTGRPQTVTYPNGQTTTYSYFGNLGDQRLQQIKHQQTTGGVVLSQFDYAYDAVGNIKTWTQQRGTSPAKVYTLGYDPADQLSSANVSGPNPLPVPSRFRYAYDSAGNRSAEQLDDAGTGASYNNRNQVTSRQPGGALLFRGTLSEPATVTVQGKPVQVPADNSFATSVPVNSGTTNVVVAATDYSSNTRTNTYQVSQSGSTTIYTYDQNGNLAGDGTRTFEWDAEDRLTRVAQGANELARFSYDGTGKRAQKIAGGVTRSYIYDGSNIIEERLSSGQTYDYVQRAGVDQPLALRDQASVVNYYLADHLGSVAQTTSAAATVTLTREYDPWGNPIQGSAGNGFSFTGREWDSETSLYYYRARYYDPKLGRFLSEDPLGVDGDDGPNLYRYVLNNPLRFTDPTGEAAKPSPPPSPRPSPRPPPPGNPWSTLPPMDKVWPQTMCRDYAFGTTCSYAVTVGIPPPLKASPLPGTGFGRRSPDQQRELDRFERQFKKECGASAPAGKTRVGVCQEWLGGGMICACCEKCS